MKTVLALCALWMPASAHAGLSDKSAGGYLDLSGGLGVAYGMPTGVAVEVGAGGWFGKYDDAFSIGRAWSFGVRGHVDLGFEPDLLDRRTALTVEFHRDIDLLVIGLRFGLQAGGVLRGPRGIPLCDPPDGGVGCEALRTALGGTVVGDAALVYRFHRSWGLQLKGELGLDLFATEAPVVPVGGVLIGLAFQAPARHRSVAPTTTEAPVDPMWSEPTPDGEPPSASTPEP